MIALLALFVVLFCGAAVPIAPRVLNRGKKRRYQQCLTNIARLERQLGLSIPETTAAQASARHAYNYTQLWKNDKGAWVPKPADLSFRPSVAMSAVCVDPRWVIDDAGERIVFPAGVTLH